MTSRTSSTLCIAVLLTQSANAFSQQPPAVGPQAAPVTAPPPSAPAPPAPPAVDPLVPTGITLAALSLAGFGLGFGLRSTADDAGAEICGLSGCVSRPDNDQRVAGASMMAGSAALAALAVPVLAVGLTGKPQARRSDRRMTAGIVLTGVGLAAVTAGFTAVLHEEGRIEASDNDTEVGLAAVTVSALGWSAIGLGLPFWVTGAEAWEPPKVRPPRSGAAMDGGLPEGVWVDRNTTMGRWGMGLTIGGTCLAGVGFAVFAGVASGGGDFSGLGGLITAAPFVITGGLATLVGIPLWAVGFSDVLVPPDDPRALEQSLHTSWQPSLQLGPTGFSMDWRFQ